MKRKRKYSYLILDASQLGYRAKHTVGEMSFKGKQTGVIFGVVKILRKVIEDFTPARTVIAWDFGKATRKLIYPDYKGQRDAKRAEASAIDRADFESMMAQMNQLWTICDLLGLPQVKLRGVEADDIIGMLCKYLPETKLVVSSDTDFLQLVSDSVSVWSPNKEGILYTLENFEELTGFRTPQEYLFGKIISGDSSDNIPGIKGIGPKTAQKILRECDGNLWIALRKKEKSELVSKLDGFANIMLRNWMLIDLFSFVNFHIPESREIIESIHHSRTCNAVAVQKIFASLGFSSILGKYTGWISEFQKLAANTELTSG